jgi:hypothetical protein
MALVIADRVKESSTTTGTGTITLTGAVTGFQAFTAIGDGNQCYYTIVNNSVATEWEVGVGTYTSSGTTLTRNTVLDSSVGGANVSFSAGNKEVFVTYPADKAVFSDANGDVTLTGQLNFAPEALVNKNGYVLKVNDDASGVSWQPVDSFGASETFVLSM